MTDVKGDIECAICKKKYAVKNTKKSPDETAKDYGLCSVYLEIQCPKKTVKSKFYACKECAEKIYENFVIERSNAFLIDTNSR